MKLIRLKINDPRGFRSLKSGFEIFFLRDWEYQKSLDFNPYILAGPNGSGKSNVLEALANIFFHMECIYRDYWPESFKYDEETNANGFKEEISTPNAFELEYFIPAPYSQEGEDKLARIKIIKELYENPKVVWIEDNEEIELSRLEVKEILPTYIVGYSSGENQILSLPFFKMRFIHFDEYKEMLIEQSGYQKPEGRLHYLDQEFNQAIILSNLLLQNEKVLNPFKEELGIQGIKSFRIIIRQYLDIHEKMEIQFPEVLVEARESEAGFKRHVINITQQLNGSIEKLKKCTTASWYDNDSESLYLDFFVDENTRAAFRLHFGTAIELFETFQILLTLNLYAVNERLKKDLYESESLYVNETIPVLQSDERIMRFKDVVLDKEGVLDIVYSKSLSDGEHQFLHALGLSLLFQEENCLFLLDEPDTHFNPNWRAKFISRLRGCFRDGKAQNVMREMLITTHTPFLISDSRPEHVLIFNKDLDNSNIVVSRPEFNTFGASINKITMDVFGKRETIGEYADQMLHDIKTRWKPGENDRNIIGEANKKLGDSVEKLIFINSILNKGENQ